MMEDKKEVRRLMNFARKLLHKGTLKKLRTVKDRREKIEVIKYSIKSDLEIKYYDLKKRIKKMTEQKKDVFFATTKANTLNSKIKFFNATFHKRDFKVILNLFKEIEKELKNA